MDNWFLWEREAAIHLLFPTLEGSMSYLKNYVGFSFPINILIFKKGIVTWCLKEDEFLDLGKNLRKIYQSPKQEKQMAKDLGKALKNLQEAEEKIKETDLEKLSNKKLLGLYQELRETFLVSYAIGAISTPLSFEIEKYLKQKVGLSHEQLNFLTTPKKDSYSKKAEGYLRRTQNIKGFLKQYFWLDNNYAGTKIISEGEARKRLKAVLAQKVIHKQVSVPAIRLKPEDKRLINLLRNYAVYKDERKKNIFIYLHYFEVLLGEIARRSGLSLDDVRNIFPWEAENVLAGKLSSKAIQKRKEYCVIVWEEGWKQAKVFTGNQARVWENKVRTKSKLENKTVKGNTACPGKVQGKARLLLSASECNLLKKGEILVTFMTSPDFMPAIRKCAAIITNLGGVTSHAAIISRELGIPCIVGTKNATEILKTGDLIEVDAEEGIVRILS